MTTVTVTLKNGNAYVYAVPISTEELIDTFNESMDFDPNPKFCIVQDEKKGGVFHWDDVMSVFAHASDVIRDHPELKGQVTYFSNLDVFSKGRSNLTEVAFDGLDQMLSGWPRPALASVTGTATQLNPRGSAEDEFTFTTVSGEEIHAPEYGTYTLRYPMPGVIVERATFNPRTSIVSVVYKDDETGDREYLEIKPPNPGYIVASTKGVRHVRGVLIIEYSIVGNNWWDLKVSER